MREKVWKRLKRKQVYQSRFLNIYEDQVQLPNGRVIDDYTVVQKPDIVMIIATDKNNKLLVQDEYRYAAGKYFLQTPGGYKEKGEDPLATAKRELLEETGYTTDDFKLLGIMNDFPGKDMHDVYVVRAKNVVKVSSTHRDDMEQINLKLLSLETVKKQIKERKWQMTTALGALVFSGVLS